ncbi:hypothetical protein EYF80_055378 [Liparis tanakae]|uniref:Uncharacterized protein n=1 Tax=Liparis tanakae TaxID=230148 RepID=A0A4Z2F011_9TELE|nr:hypothetical protein EYF80_055378 [Liparis tanakae]
MLHALAASRQRFTVVTSDSGREKKKTQSISSHLPMLPRTSPNAHADLRLRRQSDAGRRLASLFRLTRDSVGDPLQSNS